MASRRKKSLVDRIVERIYAAEWDAKGIADTNRLRLSELAELMTRPEMARALRGLRRLADAQAQILVSRYRVAAAARLSELTHKSENEDVARKACVDLLKCEVVTTGRVKVKKEEEESGSPAAGVDPEEVMKFLERMGEGGNGGATERRSDEATEG